MNPNPTPSGGPAAPPATAAGAGRSFVVPADLQREIDEVISHYPRKRSAALMVLHALQDHFGWLPREAIAWTADRLEVQPVNIFELVTFYPMFRQQPAGKYQFKVCRTLSCALGGGQKLHEHLCRRLSLDPHAHGVQTTPDGRFSIEFVECLASCGTAPVMMINDDFHEEVSTERAEDLVRKLSEEGALSEGGAR